MQAECSICMEHFESSAAISASRCGHVFHEACIARWLGESRHCPQCRTVVNKVCLTRLFFTDSSVTSRATAVNHQRSIDKLQARIDKLTDDCQLKGKSSLAIADTNGTSSFYSKQNFDERMSKLTSSPLIVDKRAIESKSSPKLASKRT